MDKALLKWPQWRHLQQGHKMWLITTGTIHCTGTIEPLEHFVVYYFDQYLTILRQYIISPSQPIYRYWVNGCGNTDQALVRSSPQPKSKRRSCTISYTFRCWMWGSPEWRGFLPSTTLSAVQKLYKRVQRRPTPAWGIEGGLGSNSSLLVQYA